MEPLKIAVIGMGATGTILAAALLSQYPKTVLVCRHQPSADLLLKKGLNVTGAVKYKTTVKHIVSKIGSLNIYDPDIIFISAKTFHLDQILDELETIFRPGVKLIATQNGLGPEDLLVDRFGVDTAFRMSLNFGASIKISGTVDVAFFNRPNHLGCLEDENRVLAKQVAGLLTRCGLDTDFVDDIKYYVWKKMVMKCTMASICAVTNKTIKEALMFGPTRDIADACFKEALAVAQAVGYNIEKSYLSQAVDYLMAAGVHRDSICYDIENRMPTEIEYLGAKIVQYGLEKNIPTPCISTMTNLVKTIESRYLDRRCLK